MKIKLSTVILICLGLPYFLSSQKAVTPVAKAWDSFKKNKVESQFSGLEWNSLGPVINSGRVEALDIDPENSNIIYAGFGSGNLWKTSNHGISWKPIFDDHAGYSIGDICIAPSDSKIIYVATGESLRAKRGHTIAGSGVYRSVDAGITWESLGLSGSHHISRIVVHPTNPEIVFVAALGSFYSPSEERGIYKSENGGRTWRKVLQTNTRVGGNDVVISPTNPLIMYASTWYCSEDKAGPGGSIYKSVNGGDTWSKMAEGFPSGDRNGRTGLAISQQNSDKVYAFTDNVNAGYENGTAELYLTVDGGVNWVKTHQENLKLLSSYGEVFTDCFVNPKDDTEVYVLGAAIMRSENNGRDFEILRGSVQHINPSPADYFHLDHHDMWINPRNPEHLIVGNDGGVYESYDHASSWFHYNNMPVGEFYFVRTDNDIPYNIYSGTQDDSSVRGPAKTLKEGRADEWEYVWIDPWSGGDGIVVTPDTEDSDIVYYESQNGAIRRKKMSTGDSKRIKPKLPEGYETELYNEWLTPFFTSLHSSHTLYYGANYMFKSTDRGDQWKVISPDLSLSNDPARDGNGIISMEESPIEKGLLYAGTSKGAVWVSQDDGEHWTEISEGLPSKYVKSFAPSKFSKSGVYIAQNGITEDDLNAYLFKSDDYGETWESIVSNLPMAPINVVLEDPNYENVLYVGTFNGVFVSEDKGASWNVLGKDMPNCFVADMTIQEREKDLIAATHGRGLYKIDLEPLNAHWGNDDDEANFLHISDAILPMKDASGGKFDLSAYEDVHFYFYTPSKVGLELTIYSPEGELVFRDSITAKDGLNSYSWDLVIGANPDQSPYLYNFFLFPEPGDYTIKLQGRDINIEGQFSVVNPK